ncbi:MAG: MBL fold metallo-hydrolase [Myxococcota bacterium]
MAKRTGGGRAAWLVLALSMALPSWAQDATVEIRTLPVADGVHMLIGRGGNIGVSTGADGVLLVDDQFAPLTPKIRAAVEALGGGAPRFLLNTHWHFDHTGGNQNFAGMGATILAHDNVRARMSQLQRIRGREIPASPPDALPVVTFGHDVTLHWNGDEIHALHLSAAHTDGDAVVHFRRANVIHTGDLFFAGGFPFIDLESGGSIDGLIAGLEAVLALTNPRTSIIPGHGPLSKAADLKEYAAMLQDAKNRVEAAYNKMQDVEAAVAASPLAELAPRWGQGFVDAEAFTRTVATDLARRR